MSKAVAALRPSVNTRWMAPLATLLALLAVLAVLNREPAADPVAALGPPASADGLVPATADAIASLEGAIRAEPGDASAYSSLGDSYLQAARETAGGTYLERARQAFEISQARDPESLAPIIGQGILALAGHDFGGGLELAREAHRREPALVRPYALMVDALVELGRYDAAARTLERMVALKPTLAAYSRVSYFRELHGDLDGAVQAMRLAVSAGGTAEGSAYVLDLSGDLEIARGRYGAAETTFRQALSVDPGYAPSLAGLARVAAIRGELSESIRGYRAAVAGLPNAENVTALADVRLAAGRAQAAEHTYERALAVAKADPVEINQELALLEAEHGNRERALALGRRAWRLAPSVESASALAWALHRNGRDEAALEFAHRSTALGSRDGSLLYRAARIAAAAREPAEARRLLQRALRANPRFSPVEAPAARRLLDRLG